MGTKSTCKNTKKDKAKEKIPEINRFASPTAASKFNTLIQSRELLHERGFDFTNAANLGMPSFIASVIHAQGWKIFGKHHDTPLVAVAVVKEFYANWLDPEDSTVYVRSVPVDCSPRAINAVYGLTDIADEYKCFLETLSEDAINTALLSLTVEGTRWLTNEEHGRRVIDRKCLLPQAKVWYNFLRSRLNPTTHDKTVSFERLLLLFALMTGYTINVGNLIHQALQKRVTKAVGKLFFPTTITLLCRAAGVPIGDGPPEELVSNKSKFSRANISKVMGESKGMSSPDCSPPRAPTGACSSNSDHHTAILARFDKQDARQEVICERLNKFWHYTKQRNRVMEKAMLKNFTRPFPPFPSFPDDILGPWTPPTEHDNNPSDVDSDE